MPSIAAIFAARWLGHGRAVESYLIGAGMLYGLVLLIPGAAFDSTATADIAWWGYGHWIALPLLLYASIALFGLLANIHGWPLSRTLRFVAALAGFMIWTWYSAKFVALGQFAAVGFPFTAMSALFSVRVMGFALAGLPRAGAPGTL